jgi:acyl dehydratase
MKQRRELHGNSLFFVFSLFSFHFFSLPLHPESKKCKYMEKLVVNSYDEFASHLGEVIGTSEWLEISQERINLFADATIDHQWIHVDPERAKVESPYKSTIAHGYLTLSLLPHLWQELIQVNNVKMLVNYGMDQMKFGQPVLAGQRVRLTASLHEIANIRGICKAQIKFKLEIENQKKQALEGLATFLYYFE